MVRETSRLAKAGTRRSKTPAGGQRAEKQSDPQRRETSVRSYRLVTPGDGGGHPEDLLSFVNVNSAFLYTHNRRRGRRRRSRLFHRIYAIVSSTSGNSILRFAIAAATAPAATAVTAVPLSAHYSSCSTLMKLVKEIA
ncbi:hypothetical protein RB195_016990 [Necator americanus]|uniref:Uncharacterized protein n=1 Tax=Necator americanus TaxID=51031 RepID=A0ABR1C675_NECAM